VRLKRINFSIVGLVLVLLGSLVVLSWCRSYSEGGGEGGNLKIKGRRYSVRSSRGSFVVFGSPEPKSTPESARAISSAQRLNNRGLCWSLYVQFRDSGFQVQQPDQPTARFSGPEEDELVQMSPSAATAALLAALEDQDRFIAAHHCLSRRLRRNDISDLRQFNNIVSFRYNGLAVELRPMETPSYSHNSSQQGKWLRFQGEAAVRIDPAQHPIICRYWHDRFDERVLSVPHWVLLSIVCIYPVLRTLLYFRARRALARGMCPTCGYDLRAAVERCPE